MSLPDALSSITSSPWALAGTALGVVALSYLLTRPDKQCVAVCHASLDVIAMTPWHCLKAILSDQYYGFVTLTKCMLLQEQPSFSSRRAPVGRWALPPPEAGQQLA